ncbi:hypothetical protein FW774_11455 [Pedobacter sp. BS3]|uniref:hypothetical protein n=1 Tax=Pedobacter sp. BS3 TaxID=2567937 RepID=UPI0011EC4F27|nr:hypothetical protein [Pedobacter sp. BS3]TZF84052.1 hypothetical protein FW774_11455 [Pedobacter sp. BS3]
MAFLKTLKTMFAGQEVEITVKSVKPQEKTQTGLLEMIQQNRQQAPKISQETDIRRLIDDSQYPTE